MIITLKKLYDKAVNLSNKEKTVYTQKRLKQKLRE